MNRDDMAIESFISYCDDMMIAEEGFKDAVKAGAKKVAGGAKFVGQKILQFIRFLRDLIKRVVAKIKGIKKETKVDSDKFFYLQKINKVRLTAISKTMNAVKKAAKKSETGNDAAIDVDLKKCIKTEELWKKQIENRKTKMIPINPAQISKILEENNTLISTIENTITAIGGGVNSDNSDVSSPYMSALSTSLQLVKKTISEANSLVSVGNPDMDKYAEKHADDNKMHRYGKKTARKVGNASGM